jgi:hypothetical protein
MHSNKVTSAVTGKLLTLAVTAFMALAFATLSTPAAAAHSHTLFTPPLVPQGHNLLDCYLMNVSDKAREASIEVLNQYGVVLRVLPVNLAPGEEKAATVVAALSPRYCKFIVEGRPADFRVHASIFVREDMVGAVSALPVE